MCGNLWARRAHTHTRKLQDCRTHCVMCTTKLKRVKLKPILALVKFKITNWYQGWKLILKGCCYWNRKPCFFKDYFIDFWVNIQKSLHDLGFLLSWSYFFCLHSESVWFWCAIEINLASFPLEEALPHWSCGFMWSSSGDHACCRLQDLTLSAMAVQSDEKKCRRAKMAVFKSKVSPDILWPR